MNRPLLGSSEMPQELQSRNRRTFFQELFIAELLKAKVFPPRSLFLAAMKFQHMRQQPSRLFFIRAFRPVVRKIPDQTLHQCERSLTLFIQGFAGIACFELWAWARRPKMLEPVAKVKRGEAVFTVVRGDRRPGVGRNAFDIVQFKSVFHRLERLPRVPEICFALESKENFEVLQRIPLDACPHRLLHNAMQIHKHAGAQHAIQIVFTRGVSAHQSFERDRFVRRVVINVQVRISFSPLHDHIHELFKYAALVCSIDGPGCCVFRAASVIQRDVAQKVFDSALFNERVGFEVEEDVSCGRLRKPSKAPLRFCGKELVNRISCVAILELKAGLMVRVRESGQGGDAALLQFLDLMFGDSRYEG